MKKEKIFNKREKLFLTFSLCNLSLKKILRVFTIRLNRWELKNYLVIKEESKKLNKNYYYVYYLFKLKIKCQISDKSFLEIKDNYQSVKNKFQVLILFIKKESR